MKYTLRFMYKISLYHFILLYLDFLCNRWAGAAMTTSIGDNSARSQREDNPHIFRGLHFNAERLKCTFLADLFGTVSFTAQHGNFQRPALDLTRVHLRLDVPSGSKFLTGAAHIAQDLLSSKEPSLEMVRLTMPEATVSLQQQVLTVLFLVVFWEHMLDVEQVLVLILQIYGPFSFRVDSRVALDLNNKDIPIRFFEPVFAIEHSLQVLGSAKGIAWYSPKNQEFMVELRFFET